MAKVFGQGFDPPQLHLKGFSQENPFLLCIYKKNQAIFYRLIENYF